ncbi:MAG: glycosyltransferase [Acidimicrobiales bacterium]
MTAVAGRPAAAEVVWQYWEDVPGRARPAYLDLCLETVCRHAGALEVRLLDFHGVLDWLPDIDPDVWRRLPDPPARSDYARARLLDRYGGLWLDIDTIALQPLDNLVALLDRAEVVGWGNRDGIMSGCIAARPGAALLTAWVAAQEEALAADWSEAPYAFLSQRPLRPLAARIGYHAIPEAKVAPVPWYEWRRFMSRIESPARVLAARPFVVVLWNAVMGPPLAARSRSRVLEGSMLLSRLMRIALGLSTVSSESPGLVGLDPLSRLRFSHPGRSAELHVRSLFGEAGARLRRVAPVPDLGDRSAWRDRC